MLNAYGPGGDLKLQTSVVRLMTLYYYFYPIYQLCARDPFSVFAPISHAVGFPVSSHL